MSKIIKSLSRLSMIKHSLGVLNNCTFAKRFVQTSVRWTTNNNKETLASLQPYMVDQKAVRKKPSTDIEHSLMSCKSAHQVFDIIQAKHREMSSSDALTALQILMTFRQSYFLKRHDSINTKEFLMLCHLIQNNLNHYSQNDIITVFTMLCKLRVPTSTTIMQRTLQIIRSQVHLFLLPQISHLHRLLDRCEHVPLTEALRIALPLVYETNLARQLDVSNVDNVSSALLYLCGHSSSAQSISHLIAVLHKLQDQMNWTSAKIIIYSLTTLEYNGIRGLPELFNIAVETSIKQIDEFPETTLLQMLRRMSRPSQKPRHGENRFYREAFVDAVASTVVSKNWSIETAICALYWLVEMRHVNISLLDYIAAMCFENTEHLINCSAYDIQTLVAGFSIADYKPVFWDHIQELILSNKNLNTILGQSDSATSFKIHDIAIFLASLDCYCPRLFQRIFEMRLPRNSRNARFERKQGELYRIVKTLYPQYEGPWPSELERMDLPQIPVNMMNESFPLLSSLEIATGGPCYVLTNVKSKFRHFIDHVIVTRESGCHVAINNQGNTYTDGLCMPIILDNLQLPANSQVILIICLPETAYPLNQPRLTAYWSTKIRSIESLSKNFTVIAIPARICNNDVPQSEKIAYLMQAIKLKCDNIPNTMNT